MDKTNNKEAYINREMLKLKTGEFDLGSILHLKLKDANLYELGCIGECTGLLKLDLSRNNLVHLQPLATLKSLTHLFLASNNISCLDGLQELEALQTLNLAGNMITSVYSLDPLTKLSKLESLRLQDHIHKLYNPICHSVSSYKREICLFLPNLKILDGERVQGPGSDLYELCDKLDSMIEDQEDAEDALSLKSDPWPTCEYWKIKGSPEKHQENVHFKEFEDILTEAKRLNQQADVEIENAKKSLWKFEDD